MSEGLRGIEAGKTSICTVGNTGDGLHYRGYDVLDLSEKCIFEEVCYLLLHGNLPNKNQLEIFTNKIVQKRSIPDSLKIILETIPTSSIIPVNTFLLISRNEKENRHVKAFKLPLPSGL